MYYLLVYVCHIRKNMVLFVDEVADLEGYIHPLCFPLAFISKTTNM